MASAGSDEGSFVKAVVKAGAAAIGDANLNKYDADGDKVIDGFGIVMAGPEKNTGMWGHMYWYSVYDSYTKYNGYKFERYFLIAQLADDGANNGIGVMTHEFSHVLGLPDFYSSYGDEWVPGPSPYDVMTQGMYNGYSYSTGGLGRQPPKYSAFERESMGWMKIEELKESDDVYVLPNIDANKAYSITNPSNQDEFYVIEYRPGIGWDSKISGTDFDNKSAETGVYIWYVNYTSDAWDYFPNKGDARRYTLAATLVGSGSNSGTKQFSASNPPRRTMATFSSRYNVYNMLKSGNDRVCFSTKQSVGVNSCPELASSSSVAPVSSSSASVVSSSSWAVASSSSTSVWRSSSSVQPVSSVAELSSSSSMVWWPISSSSSSMEGDSSTTAILEVSLNAACSLDLDGRVLNVRAPSAGAKTLRVFDLQGNELTRYGFDGAEGRFDLSGLGSGARVVRVTVGRVLLKVQRIVLK
jgi:M6 family metalloprotease-like protein